MKEKFSEIELKKQSNIIRQDVIKMLATAGSGHTAGSLGMADVLTALYFNVLNHDPKKPFWPDRDRFILSNGHIVPVRYAAMARAGYFPVNKLRTLRKFNSPLQGHPSFVDFPLMECSAGPLGQGLSIALGMAQAGQMDKKSYCVYCLIGDGEINEGQCWEAFLFAAKYRLANLTVILDRNNIQLEGPTKKILPLEPLKDKLRAFNWNVITVNGHNFKEIISASKKAKSQKSKPTVIIAKNTPGQGVSFIKGKYQWHGRAPNKNEAEKALIELKKEEEKLNNVS